MTDQLTRADLRESMRDVIGEVNRRFDEARAVGNQRHDENVDRLERIEASHNLIGERVVRLEGSHSALSADFQGIRQRWHDFRDSIQQAILEIQSGLKVRIPTDHPSQHAKGSSPMDWKLMTAIVAVMVGTIVGLVQAAVWVIEHFKAAVK